MNKEEEKIKEVNSRVVRRKIKKGTVNKDINTGKTVVLKKKSVPKVEIKKEETKSPVKEEVKTSKKELHSKTTTNKAPYLFFTVISILYFAISICLIEKGNPMASSSAVIFEVLSALNTVGISLGLTPVLTLGSKIILIFLMFIGRVGALTLLFAIHSKSPDAYGNIEYPDSKINVG